jgi:hypothetical protein
MRGRRGQVWPAGGRRRPFVSPSAPILPQPRPMVVPTTQGADDLRRNRKRHRGMAGLQSP